MKKSSIWKLLFSALTVFAVAVFAGCTDDNDDMGAPYLNVTPENLTFDAEGQPADEYNGTFIVETNRPWRAIVEDEQTWVRLSATEGEGDAAVTVTVPASNIGQSAKVTFEVYNSYGALIQKDVNVLQGEVVPPTLIFNETAGSESVANPYLLVADYTGWNTTGEGASKVSYEGVNTSIRASGKSSAGAYDGASGPNVIFFGSAPATFTVKDITLASDQTNLKLTFGGQYYDSDNNDNNFNKDNFVVYLSANGTDYTPLSYEVNDGDQVDPYWVFATKNFTLKNATSTLYIKFEAKASSKFRLDDITLMTGNGGEEIDLAGGGVVPPDPSGDAIYENNFDKTPAAEVDGKWPFLDRTDAWQNASGTGNSTVTYTSTNVSVRTSGKLSGGYDGASGSNKIFFGSAPATFDINTITMPAGKTNYRIIFGGAYSKKNGATYDNIFKPESFHVAVGNGTDWSGNLTYEKIGGSDTTDPYWIQFAVDFTLKEAVSQLSIRFTADLASAFAIDDVQLVEGNGGQEVDLEGGVVPPDPGEATAITIPELIAQMTDTKAPVDANADRYLDAVVMNDVAGGNYTFNNLILATENATEAGNGITLYGSQVEPSTLGLNKGDKVRVTLYKGLAKVENYNGMYEVTGDREATWCKVEKTGTVTSIPTATIAAADLANYQGMAVTIANASVAEGGVWASAAQLSSHTFTADGANFTVFCEQSDEKNPSVFLDVPFKAGSGNISGLAAVYKNNSQLVPRNLDDVAAFSDSSTPMITGVTPASVSIPAIGGNETIIVSVANKGENVLSVSGLSGLLEATVDNANNMVTVTAQPNTGAVQNQTLTIAIAGGNSVTVPVTLLGVGGGGTGEVVAFSITDIKADNADLPTNGYGSQVVATPSTWVSWTVGGIEFTGVKICESPASNGSIIQMQGNDSDAAKQAKLQNVTPIDGMSKIKIVFRSYPNKSGSYYNPGYTMTVAGAAQTPVETYTDKSGYREYVHEYDLAGLGADSFVLDNNKVGALYIESFEITK
ncbi:DUF5689 domain-containing protein [Alistipes putredinis]|uniref:DUF5689 domain-containing protein n=1 Tax=Alistipes putredinis TaxID=28117 RepID=UPI00242F2935|nr:DUF5689 domain-containing protein [Alistipes putredinis]